MLDGCVKHSDWKLADKVMQDMANCGVEHSSATLSIVVKMWGRRHKLDNAFEAVRAVVHQDKFYVDPMVGAVLIAACFMDQNAKRANEAFAMIKSTPQMGGPNHMAYNALICGFSRLGMLRTAVQFAEEAVDAGDAKTIAASSHEPFKQLFNGLRSKGLDQEIGWYLMQKLWRAGVQVDPY